jgi:hypothetical protein
MSPPLSGCWSGYLDRSPFRTLPLNQKSTGRSRGPTDPTNRERDVKPLPRSVNLADRVPVRSCLPLAGEHAVRACGDDPRAEFLRCSVVCSSSFRPWWAPRAPAQHAEAHRHVSDDNGSPLHGASVTVTDAAGGTVTMTTDSTRVAQFFGLAKGRSLARICVGRVRDGRLSERPYQGSEEAHAGRGHAVRGRDR